jgi:hypothetical protein
MAGSDDGAYKTGIYNEGAATGECRSMRMPQKEKPRGLRCGVNDSFYY